jgi:hypothetical protein
MFRNRILADGRKHVKREARGKPCYTNIFQTGSDGHGRSSAGLSSQFRRGPYFGDVTA